MPPVLFIPFVIASYSVPCALGQPAYVSWAAVDMVYLIDMDVSRQRFSDEMNGPEISASEAMTYAGMATATVMPLLDIPQPWDFVIYFAVGLLVYGAWSYVL